jgi:hypothetical protein
VDSARTAALSMAGKRHLRPEKECAISKAGSCGEA